MQGVDEQNDHINYKTPRLGGEHMTILRSGNFIMDLLDVFIFISLVQICQELLSQHSGHHLSLSLNDKVKGEEKRMKATGN